MYLFFPVGIFFLIEKSNFGFILNWNSDNFTPRDGG